MTTTQRFQLDMTREELDLIERLGQMAGFRTKRELLANALTLFKWATRETLQGRTICSLNEATREIRYLELPALSAIAEACKRETIGDDEFRRRLSEPTRPLSEILPRLQEHGGHEQMDSGLGQDSGKRIGEPLAAS